MSEGALKVSLLTPEKVLFEGRADSVIVPGHDGEIGILVGHVGLVARLGAGIARIKSKSGESKSAFVAGGFVQVVGNVVTILTDDARPTKELDRAVARQALDAALALPAKGEKASNEKARRVALARARHRIAATVEK